MEKEAYIKSSIKIIKFERGFCLKVNGHFIHHNSLANHIKSVVDVDEERMRGVSIWSSIKAVRDFWNTNRNEILESTQKSYSYNERHSIHTLNNHTFNKDKIKENK